MASVSSHDTAILGPSSLSPRRAHKAAVSKVNNSPSAVVSASPDDSPLDLAAAVHAHTLLDSALYLLADTTAHLARLPSSHPYAALHVTLWTFAAGSWTHARWSAAAVMARKRLPLWQGCEIEVVRAEEGVRKVVRLLMGTNRNNEEDVGQAEDESGLGRAEYWRDGRDLMKMWEKAKRGAMR
ncbi:hypothetical protein B0A48_01263 [Cryoendolithus antarcticus]|uniref:Uncharacterized protein n=1 Tax=Cryoendolithus antarcticus TaxID=1507870 RepID=A0A1V8TST7_9PEZI|nr:hypothetical protein B0A48_01263 [Cryoendolithus antarcticus]